MTEPANDLAEEIVGALAVYVGRHTASVAVKTFSKEALGRGPETLGRVDVPKLLDAIRPMLAAFVGRAQAQIVLEQIQTKVEHPERGPR